MTLGDIQIKYHMYYSLYTGCDRQHNYNTITAKQYRALYSSGSRGRGARGSAPLLGPKLDPLLDPPLFLLVDLRWTPVADPGGGGRGDHPTLNLYRYWKPMQSVRDRDRSPPPPLECGWRHTGNVQGGALVNVQEWGCFSIFLRADDVTRTMSKGGGCLWMSKRWGCLSIFRRADDVTQAMSKGGCLWMSSPRPSGNPVSAPGPPPPFQKSWIRPCYSPCIEHKKHYFWLDLFVWRWGWRTSNPPGKSRGIVIHWRGFHTYWSDWQLRTPLPAKFTVHSATCCSCNPIQKGGIDVSTGHRSCRTC